MVIVKRNNKYVFTPPYHRDSRLLTNPSYRTTHETTYPYHDTGKYDHITSRYKQDAPFVKKIPKRKVSKLIRSFRPHIPYIGHLRQFG